MSLIKEAIAVETAKLVKLVPTPQEPFGYGRDLSLAWDLKPDMAETDPNSPEGIVESVIRFCTTDRGTIPDARERGWNVFRLLNRATTATELREGRGFIVNEITQDDRIDRATVELTLYLKEEPVRLSIRVRIWPEDIRLQPFSFTFAVDGSGAVFLEAISK